MFISFEITKTFAKENNITYPLPHGIAAVSALNERILLCAFYG